MRSAWTISLLAMAAALGLAAFQPALPGDSPAEALTLTLGTPAQLSPAPGEAPMAVLMAGARLRLIERRDGWSRVALEGWIPDAGQPATPAGEAAPPEPAPALPAAAGSRASLRGVLFVTGEKGETLSGPGVIVRLLRAEDAALGALQEHRRECAARQAGQAARIAEMKKQAGRALRTIENTTRAFEESDRIKAQRDAARQALADESRACRAREEEILESHAALRAITGPDGRYVFEGVPAGSYTVQATLDAAKQRHQWLVPIVLGPEGPPTLDLTSINRTSVEEIPQAP